MSNASRLLKLTVEQSDIMDGFNNGNYQHPNVGGANTGTFMPNDGCSGHTAMDPSSANKFPVGPPGRFNMYLL